MNYQRFARPQRPAYVPPPAPLADAEPAVKLLPGIPDDRATWTIAEWESKDPKGLTALRKSHPDTVAALEQK